MCLEYTKVPHDASEKMDDTLMAAKPLPIRYTGELSRFHMAGFGGSGGLQSEDLLSEIKQQVAGYAAENQLVQRSKLHKCTY